MLKQRICYIVICISLFLCGCTESTDESYGYPSGTVQIECVMVNKQLFQYSDEGWLSDIPKGYEKIGSVAAVDNNDYPDENFHASRLSVDDEIYADSDSDDMNVIYVKYKDGTYGKFVPATTIP